MPSIRVTGTIDECIEIVEQLQRVFIIKEVSKFYQNRGSKLGRMYVEI